MQSWLAILCAPLLWGWKGYQGNDEVTILYCNRSHSRMTIVSTRSDSRRGSDYNPTMEEVKKAFSYNTADGHAKGLIVSPPGNQRKTWSTHSSLARALLRTFGGYYALVGIFELGNTVLTFIRPPIQEYVK